MKMKKLKRFLISKLNGFDIKNPPKIKKWEISTDDKICVLAPHADDEVIGCGGLLAKYGKQCDVVLLTDGAFGGDEKIQKTREDELSKVMDFLKHLVYLLIVFIAIKMILKLKLEKFLKLQVM